MPRPWSTTHARSALVVRADVEQVMRQARIAQIDLGRPGEPLADLGRVGDAELFLSRLADRLVVLDEIQRLPELFAQLRSLIDRARRPGRFLLLGSASPALLPQASESLAGRIVFHELGPFDVREVNPEGAALTRLWLRGGYPPSWLAESDEASLEWREAFIATHLERDIPAFGIRAPAVTLRRFWQMLAHVHGQLWNASRLASAFGVAPPTVQHYLDILEATYMVRRLPPWIANLGKRLTRSPKVYLRDSGLLHALLDIHSVEDLYGHPAGGASWEGWVLEQLVRPSPDVPPAEDRGAATACRSALPRIRRARCAARAPRCRAPGPRSTPVPRRHPSWLRPGSGGPARAGARS